jgi:hypothetical protein
MENVENVENAENTENIENAENMKNAENTENAENKENKKNFACVHSQCTGYFNGKMYAFVSLSDGKAFAIPGISGETAEEAMESFGNGLFVEDYSTNLMRTEHRGSLRHRNPKEGKERTVFKELAASFTPKRDLSLSGAHFWIFNSWKHGLCLERDLNLELDHPDLSDFLAKYLWAVSLDPQKKTYTRASVFNALSRKDYGSATGRRLVWPSVFGLGWHSHARVDNGVLVIHQV